MKQKFVKLTYDILQTDGLTSTDKIVLAYNLGMQRFFATPTHIAETLGLTKKTVEKSITKLRKLGLWRERTPYSGRKTNPTGVGADPTRVGGNPTGVGQNKSVSPLKTEARIERILEKNKKEGLESAAGASPLCDQPQTSFKKKGEEDSVSSEPHEIKISTTTGSEAPSKDCHPSVAPTAPPLGPDGRPMAKADMEAENLRAFFGGRPEPYTAAQVAAGVARVATTEELEREFSSLFKKRAV